MIGSGSVLGFVVLCLVAASESVLSGEPIQRVEPGVTVTNKVLICAPEDAIEIVRLLNRYDTRDRYQFRTREEYLETDDGKKLKSTMLNCLRVEKATHKPVCFLVPGDEHLIEKQGYSFSAIVTQLDTFEGPKSVAIIVNYELVNFRDCFDCRGASNGYVDCLK